MILGIDEAGRGPVIGPMVIAGLCFFEEDLLKLKKLGVKDSKLLHASTRKRLFNEILSIAKNYKIIKIEAKEIDEAVLSKLKITGLEAKYMAEIINELKPTIAYIDSPMNNTEKFKSLLKEYLKISVEIICEIKADLKYPQVSAASIIAKVIRDEEIENLKKQYGDFGSGYPSDPRTSEFIKSLLEKGELPSYVRKSWKSIKKYSSFKF